MSDLTRSRALEAWLSRGRWPAPDRLWPDPRAGSRAASARSTAAQDCPRAGCDASPRTARLRRSGAG